jgi:hypothetical protein
MAKKIIRSIPAPAISEADLEAAYNEIKGDYEGRIRNLFAACDEKRELYYRVTAAVHYLITKLDEVSSEISLAHALAKQDGNRPRMEALKFFYDSIDSRRESLIEDIANAASGETADATIARMREEAGASMLDIPEVPSPESAPESAPAPALVEAPESAPESAPEPALVEAPRKTKKAKP